MPAAFVRFSNAGKMLICSMDSATRTIAHFDLDSFFVSVEVLRDPSLKDKPVIVGGRERGVVAACSYAARRYGVHSAMPVQTALRLCPQAILLPGSRSEYSQYSRLVTGIIAAKAPLFEKASIDEFYLDLSGMERFFNPLEWTIQLRKEIMDQTGLPISFGLASNKMLAKIATDEAKPNGYLQVLPGREKEFLAPLPVNKIPGVGKQTYQQLKDLGIYYIRDLAAQPPRLLEKYFGRYGMELRDKAQGIHQGEVIAWQEAKSISTEQTFETNISDSVRLLQELTGMCEKLGYSLRKENKMAGCLTLKIRYPDFETKTMQTSIPYSFHDDELLAHAKILFGKLYQPGKALRLMGIRCSELTEEAVQTNLFDNVLQKAGLYKAIDQIKDKFGKESLRKAGGK